MGFPGLFVTATDTGVGKTTVAVAIVRSLRQRGWRVGVYKPVASGILGADVPAGDPLRLWEAAGRPLTPHAVCPQAFAAPIAPPASARVEGRQVDERLLAAGLTVWRESSDVVVVEGAGGLFSPLGDTLLNCDLARHLALPLVIVDAARLGTIGRTLATVRAARAEGLRVVAVVLSQIAPAEGGTGPVGDDGIARDGAAEIAARLPNVPVAVLPHAQATEVPLIDWSIAAGCQQLRCGE